MMRRFTTAFVAASLALAAPAFSNPAEDDPGKGPANPRETGQTPASPPEQSPNPVPPPVVPPGYERRAQPSEQSGGHADRPGEARTPFTGPTR